MFFYIILFNLLSFVFKLTRQCAISSFDDTILLIKESSTEYKAVVDRCITPQLLKNEHALNELSITQQNVLDLNEGAVTNISSNFKITFAHDNIEIIRERAFLNLPGLTEIDLSENKISWIGARAFSNLPSLEKINLMENKIELVPGSFYNLPKLSEVNLRYNELEDFNQEWFAETPALRWLWLRDNRIRSIPKAYFVGLPSLVQIHLENNELETVDKEAFKGLRNLERIYFADNKLKTFDVRFERPSKIIYMSLQFNRLSYISDETLDILKMSMLKVWITSNPWQCTCFDKLLKWGTDNNVQIAWRCNMKDTVCIIPKTDRNVCKERTEQDFYDGYVDSFGSEWTCGPGADY